MKSLKETGNNGFACIFSCPTLDHEAYSDHDEEFRKVVAAPTPVTTTTDY
jgi:hypothetical protein